MEAAASSSSSLRALLGATARSCFGNGRGGGFGERLRWRGRAGAEEFRYDALSYALNFDEGDVVPDVDGEEERAARRRGRRFVLCRSFSSSQLMPAPRAAVEAA